MLVACTDRMHWRTEDLTIGSNGGAAPADMGTKQNVKSVYNFMTFSCRKSSV